MSSAPIDYSPYYPLWGQQLLIEFDCINWQYGLQLNTPTVAISESRQYYGSWQSATRTITLSSHLITGFSWDITCLILKHEIAHQICSERSFAPLNAGHGPHFQAACDLLGLPPSFRLATGDLPIGVAIEPSGNQHTEKARHFIRKIGKLLALAASVNEHEAALAMEKASQLMARHNLQQMQENGQSEFQSLTINTASKRIEAWQNKICAILLRFFFVKVVTSTLYDPLTTTSHKAILLFGRGENVEIAHYCYQFLARQIASLWQQNRARIGGKGIRVRNSYYLGVLQGFYDKLKKQEQGSLSTTAPRQTNATPTMAGLGHEDAAIKALIAAEDRALDQFVGMRFPQLRHHSTRSSLIYQKAYEQGCSDGKDLVMHKGVGDGGRSPERALGVQKFLV